MMKGVRLGVPKVRLGTSTAKVRSCGPTNLGLCLPRLPVPTLPDLSIDFGGDCGCDIPAPCWWPQAAGRVVSFVCPGGTATLRVALRNVGPVAHDYELAVDPEKAADVVPDKMRLAPQQHRVAVFSLATPVNAPEGREVEVVAWIKGCKLHFVRWRVEVTSYGFDACHEVEIEDGPEYEHHWYDHFYCEHCCEK